jgi:hypothetical protein
VKRTALVAAVLLVCAAPFSTAQKQCQQLLVSIKPEIDIPLPPDPNLFQIGGGTAVSASYVFPFFRPLSAGILVNYHLGRLQHEDPGIHGSLSLISAEAIIGLRLTLWQLIDAYLSGGAGYFFTFVNKEPSSWATNIVLSGGMGIGLRVNPTLTVGIQGEYRRYRSLYHLIGVGLGADLRLGSVEGKAE